MEYQQVYERLLERAISFHHLLTAHSIYQEPLSSDQFMLLIEETMTAAAEGIAEGQLDPWVTVLGLCEALLDPLGEYVFSAQFDVMEGPQEHMTALQHLLQRSGYHFSWSIDEDAEVVRFKFEDIEWDAPIVDAWWAHEPPFSKDEPNLIVLLKDREWFLYVAGTGDATVRYLLIPPDSKESLIKYLVPGFSPVHPDHDPRVDWFYSGVPEDQRPEYFWEI